MKGLQNLAFQQVLSIIPHVKTKNLKYIFQRSRALTSRPSQTYFLSAAYRQSKANLLAYTARDTTLRVSAAEIDLSSNMFTRKNNADYAIMSDGTGIPFEIYGPEDGLPCILTPGGKNGIEEERGAAKLLAQAGFRCVIHDRRNTGKADIGFGDGDKSELDLQVDDSVALVGLLGMSPAVFIGESSGGRMSTLCAVRHPKDVRALVLRNMTGGQHAAQCLSDAYHYGFMGAYANGGMKSVANSMHYSSMIARNPDNRQRLFDSEGVFMKVEQISGDQLYHTADLPTLAVTAAELQSIQCPAKVFYSFGEPDDGMHMRSVMDAIASNLSGAENGDAYVVDDRDQMKVWLETIDFLKHLKG